MLLSFVGRLDFLPGDKMQNAEVHEPASFSHDLSFPSLWIHHSPVSAELLMS